MISLKVTGMNGVSANINMLSRKAVDTALDYTRETGEEVQRRAAANAPVADRPYSAGRGGKRRTYQAGHLSRNIKLYVSKRNMTATVTYLGKSMRSGWYGVFKEFGTRLMPADPFLGPAWSVVRPKYVPGLKRALRQQTGAR